MVYETIVRLLNSSEKGIKLLTRYEKLLCEEFTTVNTNYQCCPGADCTYCIKSEGYGTTTVKCNCGKLFCFKCKEDDHSPISCEEKAKWLDFVMKE